MRALLVHEEPAVRQLLNVVLAERGHEVAVCDSALEGWAEYQRAPAPLVVAEAQLSGADAAGLTRRIRSIALGQSPFILMLTTTSSAAQLAELLEAGADDCLVQPFAIDAMEARLAIAEQHIAHRAERWRRFQEACAQHEAVLARLEEAQDQLLALGEAVPGGIAWFDDEFRLVGANRYASEHLPWGKDAYVGRNLPSSEPAREVELFLASLFARAAESAAEASGSLADGPDATHVLSARTFGGGTRAVVVALDAADRQQAEAELKSARRLETAGRLAAQVAHDYNNLLWPLASYPELMKLRLPPDDPLVPMCDAMLDVARRMAGISEDLVVLGRRARSELVPLDLNQLVQETVSGLPPAPDSLHLEVRLEAKAPLVRGSAGQLTRVLTNLLMNARDAVEDAGDVVLMTENVSLAEPIGHYERVPAGEYVRVTVADNGTGIRDDIKSRLFDPFFTTKVGGKRSGTGLGLCVVHAITEDHNGHVDLESSVGIGTTFYVYIPTDPGHAMPPEASPLLRGQERILIVDDDPVQRTLLTALLGALGYRVTAAEDGDEAMDHLQADDADLVILDMRLGDGPDGAEVLRRVKALRPQQRAILLSGFADADRVQEALKLGAGGFVRKPVSMDRLAQVVRAELDRTI